MSQQPPYNQPPNSNIPQYPYNQFPLGYMPVIPSPRQQRKGPKQVWKNASKRGKIGLVALCLVIPLSLCICVSTLAHRQAVMLHLHQYLLQLLCPQGNLQHIQ